MPILVEARLVKHVLRKDEEVTDETYTAEARRRKLDGPRQGYGRARGSLNNAQASLIGMKSSTQLGWP